MELMNQFNAPKLKDAVVFLKCRVENLATGRVYDRADAYITDNWIFIEYNRTVDIIAREIAAVIRIGDTKI